MTRGRPVPFHPLLLAAYAVLFLYASNLTEADLGQVLPVLVVVLGIVGALLIAGSLVLRDALRAAILLSAAVGGDSSGIATSRSSRTVSRSTAGPSRSLWLAARTSGRSCWHGVAGSRFASPRGP